MMLSSYGIDNAADVSSSALKAVPSFGSFLIMQLLTWRQSLEAKFKFDPGRGIDLADIQSVDRDIAKRRLVLAAMLAMLIPALRATAANPVNALREE